LPQGGSIKLKLETGSYAVDWYNPRSGGPLLKGGQVRAEAGTETDLGPPPTGPAADWAALLRRVR
jgi:hypothetical protein